MQDDNQQDQNTPTMGGALGAPPTDSTDQTPDSVPSLGDTSAPTTPTNLFAPNHSISQHSDNNAVSPAATGDLAELKEKALGDLTPLVGQLDQAPEEKYKTLMMIIQASDNRTLLKEAYEAATKINDPKLRADALVGIINEINYFTQKT